MAVQAKPKRAVSFTIATVFTSRFRRLLIKWVARLRAPGGTWRAAVIVFALANLKNLPFVWHLRMFRAVFHQIYLQPTRIPPHALFYPVVSSTRSPAWECDYNLHKSNSTYFTDLDVSRTHLFTALICNAIRKDSRLYGNRRAVADGAERPRERTTVAMGGVSCLFRREIPPYKTYEIWTRLLCWDHKWFYLITHLVEPGVARPPGYVLQPGRGYRSRRPARGERTDAVASREGLRAAVFASSMAKYVVKRGRLTIPPEQVLMRADMVPPKPDDWVFHGTTEDDAETDCLDSLLPAVRGEEGWTWDRVEAERLRGLAVAENFAAMDKLHDMFNGGLEGALGDFSDSLF